MARQAVTRYIVFLLALSAQGQIAFKEHVIATDLKGGYQVVPVDINHDGKIDLIGLASGMTELVWFENPSWERHVIATNLPRMINCAAWDTDGDGIPEIVVAYEFANQAKNSLGIVALLQHDGDPRKPWTVREIDRIPTSHRLRWADMDGSGKKVLVNALLTGATSRSAGLSRPSAAGVLPARRMETAVDRGTERRRDARDHRFDWQGHGRDEHADLQFLGYPPLRVGSGGVWTRTEIAKGDPAPGPRAGPAIRPWPDRAGPLRGRHRAVARKPGRGLSEEGRAWVREVIDDSLLDGHTIVAADLDGDGNDEIVAGFRGLPRSVYIYRFAKGKWTRQTLDEGGMGASACAVADLNGDGKPDIACIAAANQTLKWYENVSR